MPIAPDAAVQLLAEAAHQPCAWLRPAPCSSGTNARAGHRLFAGYAAEKSGSSSTDQVRWKASTPSGRLPLSIATAFVYPCFLNLMLEANLKVHILRGHRIQFVKDCVFYLND